MTINRKDLEFLLSHFESPAFPRRISTRKSEDRQYAVYSIDQMLAEFQSAGELDCKVNAYKYLGQQQQPLLTKAGVGKDGNGNGHNNNKTAGTGSGSIIYDYNSLLDMSRDSVANRSNKEPNLKLHLV